MKNRILTALAMLGGLISSLGDLKSRHPDPASIDPLLGEAEASKREVLLLEAEYNAFEGEKGERDAELAQARETVAEAERILAQIKATSELSAGLKLEETNDVKIAVQIEVGGALLFEQQLEPAPVMVVSLDRDTIIQKLGIVVAPANPPAVEVVKSSGGATARTAAKKAATDPSNVPANARRKRAPAKPKDAEVKS